MCMTGTIADGLFFLNLGIALPRVPISSALPTECLGIHAEIRNEQQPSATPIYRKPQRTAVSQFDVDNHRFNIATML